MNTTATKQRINISASSEVVALLTRMARRERIPTATKAAHLLAVALEIEEDGALDAIAARRDKKQARFVSHKKAWA